MKKLFKKLALAFVAILTLSVGTGTVREVKSADDPTVTLSFADKAQRTSFSSTQQVWEQNGIKFTNDKASSSNAVADYAKPVRLYQGSKITVVCDLGNITQIVFDCNNASYATAMKNSIGTVSGATVNASSDKVTVAFTTEVENFIVAKLTAQVRMDSLTVAYKIVESEPEESEELKQIKNELNNIDARMSLSYSYKSRTVIKNTKTDTLNRSLTGITETSYAAWSDKTSNSDAVYAGQSAGGNESIQLRTNNSNSGIVTTASGGKVAKITVEWNNQTASGRKLDVYGKNSAYTDPTELYDNDKQGTKLGTIEYGTSTMLEVEGDFEYIGMRSSSGAMYLSSIEIEWNVEDSTPGAGEEHTEIFDSQFYIRCGADIALKNIKNIKSYGIRVMTGEKLAHYTIDSQAWGEELTGKTPYCYVVIALGDIISDNKKLTTEFTVEAYVEYEDEYYYSKAKTHSVVSMVEEYHDQGYEEVDHLYNYFVEEAKIIK